MVKATMRRLTVGNTLSALLLASALICTAQTKPNKTTKSAAKSNTSKTQTKDLEQEGFTLPDILLVKDLGCAKDYAKAASAEGIEQRKMLAELFKYGCVEQLSLAYHVSSSDRQVIGSLTMWNVIAVYNDRITKALLGAAETTRREGEQDGFYIGKAGWITAKDFQHVTEEQMAALIEKQKSTGAK